MEFGKRLRELRKNKRLSQDALAEIIGVSKSSISMWERGLRTPELETFEALADFFNVNMDYLKGKSEIKRVDLSTDINFSYYADEATDEYMKRLFNDPGLRKLLDATEKLDKEDIDLLVQFAKFAKKMKGIKEE